MTDFTIILRSLRHRRFSTITTIAMVAVSVGLMLTLLSMRDAGRDAFLRGKGNMHLLVSADPSPLVAVLNGIFYANPPANPISWEKYGEIRESFPWEFAIPIQQGDSFRGFPATATTAEFFTRFRPHPEPDSAWAFRDGRLFEVPFEAVIGADVADTTGMRVGDEFVLTHGAGSAHEGHTHDEFAYTVVGILEPTGTPHDRALFSDLDSSWIVHAHDRRERDDPAVATTTVEDLTDADRLITGIVLRLPTRSGFGVSAAMQQQFDRLRRDTSIVVAQPDDQIRRLFVIIGGIDHLFVAMAAVVMLSSAAAIMLALASSMEQRRRQIAIFRVLGCSRGRIFGLVVTESALIGLVGAAVGAVLCLGGGAAVSWAVRRQLGLVIDPDVRLPWLLIVATAAVLLAALAGIAPAVMAYRTPVARSLRPIG